MKYYYETPHETHASVRGFTLEAESDEQALSQLKVKYGEHLVGVMIVYLLSDTGERFRTVWME